MSARLLARFAYFGDTNRMNLQSFEVGLFRYHHLSYVLILYPCTMCVPRYIFTIPNIFVRLVPLHVVFRAHLKD
jgi:hypothetical protein